MNFVFQRRLNAGVNAQIIFVPSCMIRSIFNIPAYKISETCNFELLAIYIIDSASDMLYPFRFDRLPAIIARPPDKIMPTVVPIIAQIVFEEIYVKLCKIFQNIIIDYHCLFSSFNSFSLNSHSLNV